MDFPAVLAQLNDVPSTFRPVGNPYAQLTASRASALALFTNALDATMQQVVTFANALDGWIDLWGLLFGVPRSQGEGNIPYATRIVETVLAWVGTLPAIQAWINLFAAGGSVVELSPGPGFALTLPGWMNAAQVQAFLLSLARIRPAGIPFTLNLSQRPGLFLNAEGFLGKGSDVGTYLTTGLSLVTPAIGSTTPSAQPLIPDLFMVDPLLGRVLTGTQGTWPLPVPSPVPKRNASQFWSNGGVLTLTNPALLPSTPVGAPGTFWSDEGEVSIVPGFVSSPGVPLFFPTLTLGVLTLAGGASLPTSNPGIGTMQIWNDGNVVAIA